ncbi:DUF6401 family natural product biosynthesis protein [Phytohabitans kaempferiae]|uniref:DUF6401 family natural product biosynthesis protein n=1 Tax=Phytohabitans kaempferiae TaxID=1620943 RepID=A0ABV6LXJ7_9ACTN
MTGLFSGFTSRAATRSARSVINGMMSAFGASGLEAAGRNPGLLAAVDQHAAAIRDSLHGDLRPITPVHLAGYAEGVRDAAAEHGWTLPVGPIDWSATTDWVLLRLLAICHLAYARVPAQRRP